jgi:cellobiose-specific phosphotransferase system component IIA
MVSISSGDFRKAFAQALADSDPGAAANARRLVEQATEQLDPADDSFRAETLRGITTDGIDTTQSN